MSEGAAIGARPVGVFDSGMGGLTVLRALRETLPHESFVYLGDTARLPYGTKSAETVTRYALQASAVLVEQGIKALVVACNTASAAALPALAERYDPLPVIGVVEPGAAAVARASGSSGRVLVLATESTVRGGAYSRAILQAAPRLSVLSRPSPLLVALAEDGRTSDPLAQLALSEYAAPALAPGTVTAVLLGCTHFPVFADALRALLPSSTGLIDSAQTTALALAEQLERTGLRAPPGAARQLTRFYATDDVARFARIGSRFLGAGITGAELIDL
ncbi:MAG: glutamate racemase [Pseudomonadota bacterium]